MTTWRHCVHVRDYRPAKGCDAVAALRDVPVYAGRLTTIGAGENDELLTYLPLCHVAERIFSGWLPIAAGATINFAESPETVAQDLVELSPTYLFAVPRVWEKFYSRISTAMSEATWVGRKAYELALAIGIGGPTSCWPEKPLSTLDKLHTSLRIALVFRNIKKVLGLDRAHSVDRARHRFRVAADAGTWRWACQSTRL